VLTSYFVQAGRLDVTALLAATAAFALSLAQRTLSTQARVVRRRATRLEGTMTMRDGSTVAFDERALLQPIERTLRSLSWAMVALAGALIAARV
jgi:hypothetical protein